MPKPSRSMKTVRKMTISEPVLGAEGDVSEERMSMIKVCDELELRDSGSNAQENTSPTRSEGLSQPFPR